MYLRYLFVEQAILPMYYLCFFIVEIPIFILEGRLLLLFDTGPMPGTHEAMPNNTAISRYIPLHKGHRRTLKNNWSFLKHAAEALTIKSGHALLPLGCHALSEWARRHEYTSFLLTKLSYAAFLMSDSVFDTRRSFFCKWDCLNCFPSQHHWD